MTLLLTDAQLTRIRERVLAMGRLSAVDALDLLSERDGYSDRANRLEVMLRRIIVVEFGSEPCSLNRNGCVTHGYELPCPVGEAQRLFGMDATASDGDGEGR